MHHVLQVRDNFNNLIHVKVYNSYAEAEIASFEYENYSIQSIRVPKNIHIFASNVSAIMGKNKYEKVTVAKAKHWEKYFPITYYQALGRYLETYGSQQDEHTINACIQKFNMKRDSVDDVAFPTEKKTKK